MDFDQILSHPAFWIVVAAASEIIGLSSLKDNSIIQFLFTALRTLKRKKS